MSLVTRTLAVALSFVLAACSPSAAQIKKLLVENPDILTEAMEKNAGKFGESLQKVAMEARRVGQEKQAEEKQKAMEDQLKNPKKVAIGDDRAFRGGKDSPMLLVIYSDFQCPFCQRGAATVEELQKKYGDKLKVVFKHLPLDFHPLALPAAKRFEAIADQSPVKAWKYHDELFKAQNRMQTEGEKLLDSVAQKVGADMGKMKKDMNSEKVMARIQADMQEASTLGIRGTPGFLINGVVVHGAMPAQAFEDIISKRPSYN